MKRQTTKDILAESFLELAQKKRVDKITITEITNNCQMSQPTFYNHFKDKYDMIVWIYVRDARKIMEKVGVNGYAWRDTLFDAADYYAYRRDFVVNALQHTSGHDAFFLQVQQANINFLVREVRKKLMTEHIPDFIYGLIKIYCYGTVQFMFEWLLSNMKLSSEKVVEIWEASLPEPLKRYLYE